MEILIVGLIISSLIGALIGKYKGRTGEGALAGFLLGPIGWLIAALFEDRRQRCSECGGVIVEGARKCMHCGSLIERMLDVRCPKCGEGGEIRESLAGEPVSCPKCRHIFRLVPPRL